MTTIYTANTNSNVNTNTNIFLLRFYDSNGNVARIVNNNGNIVIEITKTDGSIMIYSENNMYNFNSTDATMNQYTSDSNTTGSDYNTIYNQQMQRPSGNIYSSYDSSSYYNSNTQEGIPRSMIPPGSEDLYILKSEIVPPVCPAPIVIEVEKPSKNNSKNDTTKCPPCPPCARCPEPNFDCKKVPNYSAFNPDTMPIPVLSDFSAFGM